MINLTEEHLKNQNIFTKIKHSFQLDLYYASTLYDIESYFKENPPKKKDFFRYKSAFVLVNNIAVKKFKTMVEDFDYLNKDEFKMLEIASKFDNSQLENLALYELDRQRYFPRFIIKDISTQTIAFWMAGGSKDYLELKEEFQFNENTYVKIPEVLFQYRQDLDRGSLWIRDLRKDNIISEDKEDFWEKIAELIEKVVPKLPKLIPQPT